jgi:hypothetical protein
LPLEKILADADMVAVPSIEEGVISPEGSETDFVNANFGEVIDIVLAVHVVLLAPLTIDSGARSSCIRIKVSADCVKVMASNEMSPNEIVKKLLPLEFILVCNTPCL